MVKNRLWNYCHPLKTDEKTGVAIIGAGITGALIAHHLLRAGIDCCLVDKRTPATGSSCASTALLQYEIDIPLCRMAKMMPEKDAVTAFMSCLESIDEMRNLFVKAGVEADFRQVPSVFLASDGKGLDMIREEYGIRRRYGLPVCFLDRNELRRIVGVDAPGALMNRVSAQIDTYKAAVGLMKRDIRQAGLRLFSHTPVKCVERDSGGCAVVAHNGKRLKCKYVIVASGFEAGSFLPQRLMRLTSTFAIVSKPVDRKCLWPERSLIWETRNPYLYVRTDAGNRIIVGGGDVPCNSAVLRRLLLPGKAAMLARRFRSLYPSVPFEPEFLWAGTFSSTSDGLPIIGSFEGDGRLLFALGYGGNGITFSQIAAEILTRTVQGKKDSRAAVFSPCRQSLCK